MFKKFVEIIIKRYIKICRFVYLMEIKGGKIILEKELNNLDKLAIDFIKILKSHSDYVLISGYVSILFGRSRISEDIDMLIPKMDFLKFVQLYGSLVKNFWCINGDDKKELFDMLESGHSIRFARKEKVIPNIELKFAKKFLDKISIDKKIEVIIGKNTLFVSPIELQIAYKEKVLKSPKDMEDALHLREVFKDKIEKEKIKYYEELIRKHEGYK